MSRHLFLLGLIAVPAVALTACDSQPPLAKAQPGECYSVVGKDSMGQPKFAKTACAGSAAALAAACPAPATPAPGAPNAACPTTGPVAGAKSSTTHKASSSGATVKKSVRRAVHTRTRPATRSTGPASHASRDYAVARSGEVTSLGLDYARVDQELAGGPDYGRRYERAGGYAGGGYERREHYGRVDHLPPPPPPPPPPAYHARGARVEYSEHSRQSRSYSEAYSSSSYSSRGGYGRVECDCEPGGRGQPLHSPFDGYGYLTWRGKTPG